MSNPSFNKIEKQDKHNNVADNTIDPFTSINIIDKFLRIYNIKHGTNGSMFENIDIKNPVHTNNKMETFYEYMQQHNSLYLENPDYIDVYNYNSEVIIDGREEHEIYALIIDSDIKYLSLSYISLLTIGVKNEKELGDKWIIVAMD